MDIDKRKKAYQKISNMCRNNYFSSFLCRYPKCCERGRTKISGNFHRNAAVYHGVKNIARIIRRYSNWIYIHRDSRWSGLSATQGHSCTDKWVFQRVGGRGIAAERFE